VYRGHSRMLRASRGYGVGGDNGTRWRLHAHILGRATGLSLVAPLHRLGHLTSTPTAHIMVVANVSLWSRLTGRGPEGTVGHNPTIGVT